MIPELNVNWVPEELFFRDKEIKEINELFNNESFQNILIRGYTGSGKTSVIKHILKNQDKEKYIYVSGSITKTPYQTIKSMADLKFSTEGKILQEFISSLKENPKIIIIDELNKIIHLERFFELLNTIYRETMCPIIAISNDMTIFQKMPEDTKKTLFFKAVVFKSYNAIEIKKILEERLKLIYKRNNNFSQIPESSLQYISALATREGSIRVSLDISFKCLISKNFSQEFIGSIVESLKDTDWKEWYLNINQTEKRFLRILINYGDPEIIYVNGDFQKYLELSPGRISQLINSFYNYGVIKFLDQEINRGRSGGRMRRFKVVSPEIFKTLEKISE